MYSLPVNIGQGRPFDERMLAQTNRPTTIQKKKWGKKKQNGSFQLTHNGHNRGTMAVALDLNEMGNVLQSDNKESHRAFGTNQPVSIGVKVLSRQPQSLFIRKYC